jgi:hypothetical protein
MVNTAWPELHEAYGTSDVPSQFTLERHISTRGDLNVGTMDKTVPNTNVGIGVHTGASGEVDRTDFGVRGESDAKTSDG